MITVREAVHKAIDYVQELGAVLPTANLRLEETEFDREQAEWNITLSFLDSSLFGNQRSYKRFRVDAETGEIKSMSIRSIAA